MNTLLLKVSFLGHILTFLSCFSNLTNFIKIPTPVLMSTIYFAYFSDMLSCYTGVIPFYRCKNTKDIYRHHIAGLGILSLTLPSLFLVYQPKINSLINKIISVAFLSSLNEAIMIYGTTTKLSKKITSIELLFKIYIFSINTAWNIYNKFILMSYMNPPKIKYIPLYLFCIACFSFYKLLYPGLLMRIIYKFKQLHK